MQHIQAFREQLSKLFVEAEAKGETSVIVRAGDLHALVGGYPAPHGKHRMPICCDAMRQTMHSELGDELLSEPQKGKGANLTIRYVLPRPSAIGIRSPSWSRDELILALDLYFEHSPSSISKKHPSIVQLSDVLNALGARLGTADGEKFRNPNGVYMKLCNFLRFDPNYHGSGLKAGGKLEKEVWNDFWGRRSELRKVADAIKLQLESAPYSEASTEPTEDEESEFAEGAVLFRMHRQRERSRKLVEAAKARAKSESGKLVCQVCGFDFKAVYGTEYIECHHTVPVSELQPGEKTRIEDVALLCANCHRVVHRKRPWLTIEKLVSVLSGRANA